MEYSDLNEMARLETNMLVTDFAAIRQSLAMIFATLKGSRWWRPEFGANIEKYLFDPFNEITANNIRLAIYDVVNQGTNGEDRIAIQTVTVDMDYTEQLYIVSFDIGTPDPVVFELESYGATTNG